MNETIKQQLCREDFYLMLQNACLKAGGGDIEKLKKMSLTELVNTLAHNGIRMVYMPDKHMDSIKISWEDPSQKKTNDAKFYTGDGKELNILPKKKQLLCDQLDHGDEDDLAAESLSKSKFGGYYGG
jgi:hypothetical protein